TSCTFHKHHLRGPRRRLLAILVFICAARTTRPRPGMNPTPEPAAAAATAAAATEPAPAPMPLPPPGPTAQEAAKFVADSEARLAAMNVDAQRASCVQSTYITDHTQIIAPKANEKLINAGVQ